MVMMVNIVPFINGFGKWSWSFILQWIEHILSYKNGDKYRTDCPGAGACHCLGRKEFDLLKLVVHDPNLLPPRWFISNVRRAILTWLDTGFVSVVATKECFPRTA